MLLEDIECISLNCWHLDKKCLNEGLSKMAIKQITLTGKLVEGHQVASGKGAESPYPVGTIAMQKPFFKKLGLDLSGYFEGTLNLKLPIQSFHIEQPDFCFENLVWAPGFNKETFSFLKCQILYKSQHYAGWVYYPHPETKTLHFQQNNMIEILAPTIENIVYGDELTLICREGAINFK